jgi:hypothetical protein
LEFRTGYRVDRKEKLLPSPARWDIFQHAFALAVDLQERICHALLALRGNGRYHTQDSSKRGQGAGS